MEWYHINNIDEIDSPALVVYKERVIQNINTAISMVGDVSRLRPHVKTHKAIEAAQLMMDAGITKFKCATIAEAEMLAMINAPDVLFAYQPVGPKLKRFITLIKKYPSTKFSCLVDDPGTVQQIADTAVKNNITIPVYIDLDIGMNRTGIMPGKGALELYNICSSLKGVQPEGLHAYDGHLRNADFQQRTIDCNKAFEAVAGMHEQLQQQGHDPKIIAGGSPTFPIHAKRENAECSPGTIIYWDRTYQLSCEEQQFVPAALVIARVISLPAGKLCIDLGHKSIAAENELQKRVYFLNARELKFVSHSEEHLVAEPAGSYRPGDIFYGLPYHICPTVALYERALVAQNNTITGEWKTIARDRKIEV